MQKVDFIKMHGLGNDFVIIDKRSNNIAITEDIIKKLSDRRTGAGCDQLITINNTGNQNADAEIEIFNPGGDRAEACGNGTRCVAKILFDEDSNKEILKIQSDAGILESKKIDNNISVNMGLIKNSWDKIPLSKEVDTMNIPIAIDGYSNGVAVNVGNPHVVFFGKSIQDTDLSSIGPRIENHELFPKKTNVEIVEIINSSLSPYCELSAFAIADFISSINVSEELEFINDNISKASTAFLPLTRFTYGLSFFTEIPIFFVFAFTFSSYFAFIVFNTPLL